MRGAGNTDGADLPDRFEMARQVTGFDLDTDPGAFSVNRRQAEQDCQAEADRALGVAVRRLIVNRDVLRQPEIDLAVDWMTPGELMRRRHGRRGRKR